MDTYINSENIRRSYFLLSAVRWFDWINLARALLQNLRMVHEENVVIVDFQLDSIWVQKVNSKTMPHIIDFRNACYGNSATKHLLGRLPREEHATSAHGFEDAVLPKHVSCDSPVWDVYVHWLIPASNNAYI